MLKSIIINFIILFIFNTSFAKETLEIKGGNVDHINILIKDFTVESDIKIKRKTLRKIKKRIKRQLNDTSIFRVYNDKDSLIFPSVIKQHFRALLSKAQILNNLNVSFKKIDEEYFSASVAIYNTVLERDVLYEEIIFNKDKWYDGAARISDVIYKKYTGLKGYINTKLVFVSESKSIFNRVKRISIMNLYGDEHQYITNGQNLVLSPKFSNDGKSLIYIEYIKNINPQLILYNLNKKKGKKILKKFPGLLYAARFFKNNKKLVLSATYEGNSEIAIYDIKSKTLKKITNHIAIDTSPDISKNGQDIVFSSDRGGKPELYLMDIYGNNLRKIAFDKGGRYGNPTFSPDGKYIAFTRILNNKFSIGIVNLRNLESNILTTSYKDESPTWSRNSKFIIFTRQNKRLFKRQKRLNNIYLMNLNGNIITKIRTPNDASEPFWLGLDNDDSIYFEN